MVTLKHGSLCMDTGKDVNERGRHQALAVLVADHGLKDTSIIQRTQESNTTGSCRRYRFLVFNVCAVHYFPILGWNDVSY